MPTKEPSYQSVARSLRERILHGEFAQGQQLPTEVELTGEFGVCRQTVRRAYQDLVSEGIVYRVRGKGTFAAPPSDGYVRQVGSIDDLMGLSEDTAMKVVQPLTRKVDLASASRLRLTSDFVYELKFVRIHDGNRFCATTVCLPPQVAELLADVKELHKTGAVSTLTVIGLLDSRLKSPIAEAQQSITVGEMPTADAKSLGVPEGRPSLRVDRLYIDADGIPVELSVSHFLPEHYSYRIGLRRSADPRH